MYLIAWLNKHTPSFINNMTDFGMRLEKRKESIYSQNWYFESSTPPESALHLLYHIQALFLEPYFHTMNLKCLPFKNPMATYKQ